jgi:hypothetical protein
MLEQQGNALTFLAFYTESKVGKTGLTVTCDVWEGTSEIITAGSAVEIGDGLYYYTLASGSVDASTNYVAVFKTATSSVDQQHIPALWVVGRTWVNRVDEAISAAKTLTTGERTSIATAVWASAARTLTSFGTLAADVWAYASRTLTQTAAQIATILTGTELNIPRGDKIEFSQTIGSITGWKKLYFIMKTAVDTPDGDAILWLQVSSPADAVNDGLKRVEGVANTLSNGTLTVDTAATGAVSIDIEAAASTLLEERGGLWYGYKWIDANDDPHTLTIGVANITSAIVEATS